MFHIIFVKIHSLWSKCGCVHAVCDICASSTGTIMATLTRKNKSTEIMPKYEMVTYYRGSTIPNSHIHMYDPDNVNVACSIFRVSFLHAQWKYCVKNSIYVAMWYIVFISPYFAGLTPGSTALLEKLIVPQLVNKYLALYRTKSFITMFTKSTTCLYPESD